MGSGDRFVGGATCGRTVIRPSTNGTAVAVRTGTLSTPTSLVKAEAVTREGT